MLSGLRFLKNHLRILHRDIKPHNILVQADGASYCLADFGISKVLDRNENTLSQRKLETQNVAQGTLDYLAPEIVELWKK